MIPALATLLVFQLLGESLVLVLGAPVPGPVVGLALLLPDWWDLSWQAALALGGVMAKDAAPAVPLL